MPARNRTVSRIAPQWSSDIATRFVYDGGNLVLEYDADPGLNSGRHTLRTYGWGLDVSGSEQGAGGIGRGAARRKP